MAFIKNIECDLIICKNQVQFRELTGTALADGSAEIPSRYRCAACTSGNPPLQMTPTSNRIRHLFSAYSFLKSLKTAEQQSRAWLFLPNVILVFPWACLSFWYLKQTKSGSVSNSKSVERLLSSKPDLIQLSLPFASSNFLLKHTSFTL